VFIFSEVVRYRSFLIGRKFVSYYVVLNSEKTVKAIPLQAWAGPEGSRRVRLPDFKTIGT